MDYDVVETPIRFVLHGKQGEVRDNRFGEVGLGLMDAMWKAVKEAKIPSTGINYWVYLPNRQMFVGVELLPGAQPADQLQPLEFELQRYLKHLHVGPYQELPVKWRALENEIESQGETVILPSLEIYGHHCADASKLETTILLALQPKNA